MKKRSKKLTMAVLLVLMVTTLPGCGKNGAAIMNSIMGVLRGLTGTATNGTALTNNTTATTNTSTIKNPLTGLPQTSLLGTKTTVPNSLTALTSAGS